MIQPQNSEDSVQEFLTLMKLDPQQRFTLQQNDPSIALFYYCTLCYIPPFIKRTMDNCHLIIV